MFNEDLKNIKDFLEKAKKEPDLTRKSELLEYSLELLLILVGQIVVLVLEHKLEHKQEIDEKKESFVPWIGFWFKKEL